MKLNEARAYLKEDRLCDLFRSLYGEKAEAQKERYLRALDRFEALFGSEKEIGIFSAPGRTEIGGNHTDHNGGRVLAGSVDYDVIAVVAKEEGETVHIHSEGFTPDTVDLAKLSGQKGSRQKCRPHPRSCQGLSGSGASRGRLYRLYRELCSQGKRRFLLGGVRGAFGNDSESFV